MDKKLRLGLRTWIEIDKKAIKHNYDTFRKLIPKTCKYLAVVKSNAYGHGLVDFSKEVERLGVDFLGVDSIVEALTLRENGIKCPILVLGYTLPEMFGEALKNNISISVSSFETLREIRKLDCFAPLAKMEGNNRKTLKIHIKVDTGMGRLGFDLKEVELVISKLNKIKNVEVEGLFTHFSSAKDPNNKSYTLKQIDSFKEWIRLFKQAGFNPICHASATSGTLLFPEANFDMVRIGISQYGIWPSEESEKFLSKKIKIKPILSWKTIVCEVKKKNKGSKIGYDGTHILKKDSVIAVCPIGYWHGYPRSLSNKGIVFIGNKKVRVVGRVCMDMIMIDVTDIPNVKVGTVVELISNNGFLGMEVTDVARIADMSSYEFPTRLNPLIKKFYL